MEETAVQNCEQQLSDLRRRSTSIAPLRQRRTNLNRPVTVESLCDWDTDKVALSDLKLLSGVQRIKRGPQAPDLQLFQIWSLSLSFRASWPEGRSSPWNPMQTLRTGTLSPLMAQRRHSQESASRSLHLIQRPFTMWTCKWCKSCISVPLQQIPRE